MDSLEGPTINVILNSSNAVPIKTDTTWNIGRLKEEISSKHNVPKEEIKLIFQGKELKDAISVQVHEYIIGCN